MSTAIKMRGPHKTKVPASQPYEPWLKERLAADPQEAKLYLEAAMEDDDPRVFLLALKDVADAYGGMGRLAQATGLNRENLYRMLSAKGNPELASLSRVLQALGLRLKVEPVDRARFRSARLLKNVRRSGWPRKSAARRGGRRPAKPVLA
ncbi:MAG: addiction module antidote protein [Nitrospirota bacterium]